MKIFYLRFEVIPNKTNQHYNLVAGALAHCWISCNSPQSARAKAKFHVLKKDWYIVKIEQKPIVIVEKNFVARDMGLDQYLEAKKNGSAFTYTCWSRDGKTTVEPFRVESLSKFNIESFIVKQKKLKNKKRCLHYDSGERCNEVIRAHSIQKSGCLSSIAEEGHVYKLSMEFSGFKKADWKQMFVRKGINKVSTFLGFCRKHDNELFGPIDNFHLRSNDRQVFLYAYRSLCREIFVKENALKLGESCLREGIENKVDKNLLLGLQDRTSFSLKNLINHKKLYDASLKEASYQDIKYVLFLSKQKPSIAFSGLIYPEFDFMGRILQDLADFSRSLSLITFCSAQTLDGWGFLFAWEESSSKVCAEFMESLAAKAHEMGGNLGDLLFRLVVSNCENLAISPEWWGKLPSKNKEKIAATFYDMANLFYLTEQTYLMNGLEGVTDWKFEKVISNMD